jgi:SulP family sulfate permease
MMTDMDLTLSNIFLFFNMSVLIQWVPGLVFAVVLLLASRRISHYLLTPGILLGSILLFYGFTSFQGLSFNDLETGGFLLGPFPEGGLFPGTPFPYVLDFRWDLFLTHLPAIATMMILNAISILFNYSGLELIVKEDFDLDNELKITGYGNILAGLAGTPPGYITLSETSMAYNIGARTRLANIIVALMCGITLVFGATVVSIFPKVILGGLLLNLGLDFLVEWLVDTWKRLQRMDYFVIVIILLVIGTVGFLEGIVIGLLMSIALFVIKYSKVEVIKYELSGKTFSSNVGRSEPMNKILEEKGDQIFILPLQGFVFFGTANQILERVQKRFESDPSNKLSFLVFDFRQVTGVDSSAVNSFNKLQIMAEKNNFQVLLCGMSDEIHTQFETENLINDASDLFNVFSDLDHGLEWCEESIIQKSLDAEGPTDHPIRTESFKDKFQQVADFFEYRKEQKGTRIIEQGKDPGGIYFIDSGQISVLLDTGDGNEIRLKTMGAGTVVGEVSLYLGSNASASVVTDEMCKIYYLSTENFHTLNRDAPDKASELHTYVVKLLSDRLAESNATIRALMR